MAKKVVENEPMLEETSDEVLLEETSGTEAMLEETSDSEVLLEEDSSESVLIEEDSEVLLEESIDNHVLLEESSFQQESLLTEETPAPTNEVQEPHDDSLDLLGESMKLGSTLSPTQEFILNQIQQTIQNDSPLEIIRHLPRLEALAKSSSEEIVQFLYNVTLAAFNPSQLIKEYESSAKDNYWQAYWAYIAYAKTKDLVEAEKILASLSRFSTYSATNLDLLSVSSYIITNDSSFEAAIKLLDAIDKTYSQELELFSKAIRYTADHKSIAVSKISEGFIRFYTCLLRYNYYPKTKEELSLLLDIRLMKEGLNANLNDIYTGGLTDMSELFKGLPERPKEIDISQWDVSNVKNMSKMFVGCSYFNSDLSNWDVSTVTDMSYMFTNCHEFKSDISKWDVSAVTDMNYMFYRCDEFNSDLSKWDVSSVVNMASMFCSCKAFNSDLSKWDVSSVVNMGSLFSYCPSFKSDISRWSVSSVTYMSSMFSQCTSFKSDLSKWDISSVIDMSFMFCNCTSFNSDLSKWDVHRVQNMFAMFKGCSSFESDLSHWNVSNVKKMSHMFEGCTAFYSDLSSWNVSKVTSMEDMFEGCENMEGKAVKDLLARSKVEETKRKEAEEKAKEEQRKKEAEEKAQKELEKLKEAERMASYKTYNGHECVDLGLPSGTLWATCNIGASKPEEFGNYFSWGETSGFNEGKRIFDLIHYKFSKFAGLFSFKRVLSKYSKNDIIHNTRVRNLLDQEDDAAYTLWGKGWTIPTIDHFRELTNPVYTTCEVTALNGVGGLLIKSKNKDCSIFLPFAKKIEEKSLSDSAGGYYWSKNLCLEFMAGLTNLLDDSVAQAFSFNNGLSSNTDADISDQKRVWGLSIRPIRS